MWDIMHTTCHHDFHFGIAPPTNIEAINHSIEMTGCKAIIILQYICNKNAVYFSPNHKKNSQYIMQIDGEFYRRNFCI